MPGQHPGAVPTHSWFSGKNCCTHMPQFPRLSKDMTMPFENLGALWLEVTTSAVLLRVPKIETVCDTILFANILSDEKFMPFLKHFCKHKQLLRTLASFKYPAILLNVVAFPVFIFPPPGPFAQQTCFFFPFGCACLERVSQEAQHRQSLKPQGWSWGYLGDQEETCVPGWPAALLVLVAETETLISSTADQ